MDYGLLELAYVAVAAFATAMLHSIGGFTGALMLAIAIAATAGIMLHVTKIIAFGLLPLLKTKLAPRGIALGLCTFPGHAAGRWVIRRNRSHFTRAPLRLSSSSAQATCSGKG